MSNKYSHPLDPLTKDEIVLSCDVTTQFSNDLKHNFKPKSFLFNTVTLVEPPKHLILNWLGHLNDLKDFTITRQAEVSYFCVHFDLHLFTFTFTLGYIHLS